MAHPRELISQAVVALLVAANTAAGSRVYETRVDPNKKGQLPALSVYALDDPTNDEASSEMEEAHSFDLRIICWVAPAAVNALADQVEAAMRADPYFGGLASDSILTGTAIDPEAERGDPLVAIAVITYAVTYHIALEST